MLEQMLALGPGWSSTPELRLYEPEAPLGSSAQWLINGFPATLFLWTEDEWRRLTERPTDARYFKCGIWGALRMD